MKKSTLATLVLLFCCANLQAQKFSLQPQVGMQQSFTRLMVNNLNSFEPLSAQLAPQLAIRADYKLKNGFGPFVGVSTNRSTVAFNFSNPETALSNYTASMGDFQVQLQAGVQARTKPLYFKKTPAPPKQVAPAPASSYHNMSRCGRYKEMMRKAQERAAAPPKPAVNKSWFVSIVPSVGLAYNPGRSADLSTNFKNGQMANTYIAGNSSTALITGVAFEVGSNQKKHFTINVNYSNGLGNNQQTMIVDNGVKSTTTTFDSKVSGWNVGVGLPISFTKKAPEKKPEARKQCQFRQSYQRCRKVI